MSELNLEPGEVVPHCALGDGDVIVERGLIVQPLGDGGPRHIGSPRISPPRTQSMFSAEHK